MAGARSDRGDHDATILVIHDGRYVHSVHVLNGEMRFAIDEEGDAARFCSDDPALLS